MLKLRIATPERLMMEKEVESVTIPTQMGEVTILPNHIPLVANIVPGEIKYKTDGEEDFFAVSEGFLEVKKGNEVSILADSAEFGHEIDIKRAQVAKERAVKLMKEAKTDDEKFDIASIGIEKHAIRLRVANKHRTKTHKNLESGTLPK